MCVRHWLSDAPYNRHDFHGNRSTVDEAVAGALKLVAEKEAADPHWFVKRAEAAYDAPPIVRTEKPNVSLKLTSRAVIEPEQHPLGFANRNLDATAAIVLSTDSWLSNLTSHSEDMRSRIIVELGNEIRRSGHVDAEFCMRLYNSLRPTALSKYPPRQ